MVYTRFSVSHQPLLCAYVKNSLFKMTKELIEQRQLANGMVLSVFDASRKVAGDRFFVKVECEVVLPLTADFFDQINDNDSELLDTFKHESGKEIIFSIPKERNFVAEPDKDAVVFELVEQVSENLMTYLENPVFAQKLFKYRYEKFKRASLAKRHIEQVEGPDEDDGPVDFSACFRD